MTKLTVEQIDEIRARVARVSEIELGSLPSVEELRQGYPFARLSMRHDQATWLRSLLVKLPDDEVLGPLREAIDLAIADGSAKILRKLRGLIERMDADGVARDVAFDANQRLEFYLAIDDQFGSERVVLIDEIQPAGLQLADAMPSVYRHAFAVGLRRSSSEAPEDVLQAGLVVLEHLGDLARLGQAAEKAAVGEKPATVRPLDVDLDTVEDIVEQQQAAGLFHPPAPGVVVIPTASGAKTGASKDIWKSIESVAGKSLPLKPTADLTSARGMLSRRFPHLLGEVDIALRAPHPLRLLLVGDPGAGKTSVGRALADALGLPSMLYSAAGVADGAFGGTSAQWASSRMSVPLQLIVRSHAANPIMVVDELDKVDLDRRNGSLADSLLGFLERSSAQRLMDLALEVEVDLSHVGYIATANDLDSVPAMLRDRFKIVRVPLPELVHLPALTEHLLTDLAAERGVNRAWLLPLDGDEIELVGRHWKSRSLRQLRRFIEQIVEGRERLAVRS